MEIVFFDLLIAAKIADRICVSIGWGILSRTTRVNPAIQLGVVLCTGYVVALHQAIGAVEQDSYGLGMVDDIIQDTDMTG